MWGEGGVLLGTSEEVEFHAVKSGHSNFSESTEEKKPLTEEEKLLKKRTLEDKIRQRRREREMEEEKEARDRERKRIQMGQEIAERKRNMQDQELKRIAEERKKEKMEDKIARQKVKEEIERDRQARKEMFGNKGEEKSQAASVAPKPQPAPAAQTAPKKEYTTARLQRKKLVGNGADGASVMTDCKNGLVACMRRDLEWPELEGIHCTAHKLELAYKDAMKGVPLAKRVDLLLLGIYLFYEKCSLNRSLLKQAHEICQLPFFIPTRLGDTRWLPRMLQALEHLQKSYKAIVLHMQ
ncbi:UBX domain-containing protein 1-like [Homarus americanus]|uniref:UBX domain-containing protein 1-like n=1 Tax=Homarus americanus TaxID=6706 RepID=A0A8J5MVR0_HOMAM|nr:UBX domain-containing protein 1-like [Homarus americanus]